MEAGKHLSLADSRKIGRVVSRGRVKNVIKTSEFCNNALHEKHRKVHNLHHSFSLTIQMRTGHPKLTEKERLKGQWQAQFGF